MVCGGVYVYSDYRHQDMTTDHKEPYHGEEHDDISVVGVESGNTQDEL